MRIRLISLVIFTIAIACQTKTTITFEEIKGDWFFDTVYYANSNVLKPPSQPFNNKQGYTFKNDKKLLFHPGFYSVDSIGQIHFFGDETTFNLKEDSLIFFDPITSSWRRKSVKISKDSLWLGGNGKIEKYIRQNLPLTDTLKFDEIILSSSECFGFCIPMDILINKNGNTLLAKDSGNSRIFVKTILQKDRLQRLWRDFSKANLSSIDSSYVSGTSDLQTIYLSFTNHTQIIKSIKDYGLASPTFIVWAYWNLLNMEMDSSIEWKHIDINFQLPSIIVLIKGDRKLRLSKSESFFLQSEILKGIKVNQQKSIKTPIMTKDGKIKTDGRFFTFEQKNKKITIDIGYNFIENNRFLK
ncbi:DUF6438 domain-containing protein [Rhizosphaericola mali]|uniref:DUF6438 domain-containing protein n=1 Tax=Rhizosphaericola mali TaxID=2545455 RepID=A0A5P2G5L7_9BACT|nr:DUF6438 domain-containing protein [Rhizosphaericola mali]QES89978.1 hypothetical protein E0W69_015360 [Rhizosphaericola mali]